MNKLAKLIARGEITPKDLVDANELIERIDLVKKGLQACKKNIVFPLGVNEVQCYSYTDSAGEYQAWGTCKSDGVFSCSTNWGGRHVIGSCNLLNFEEVFEAFENRDFASDLRRFLLQQIEKAS